MGSRHAGEVELSLGNMEFAASPKDYGTEHSQIIKSHTLAPTHAFKTATATYPLTSPLASHEEIYIMALAICFLALLIGWLLIVCIRTSLYSLARKARKKAQEIDPESGILLGGEHVPEEGSSLLCSLRNVSTGSLIKSAGGKSLDFANGITKEIGPIRRKTRSIRYLDEEAAVGCNEGEDDDSMEVGGYFLRLRHGIAAVLPA